MFIKVKYQRTPEHCANISKGKTGHKQTPEHVANHAAALRGRKCEKQSEAMKRHATLDIVCNCYVHSHSRNISSLTWLLAEALNAVGFQTQPETQLDRRSIDVLLIDEWIAFEADGDYWHQLNEDQFPGYHEKRDNELLTKWGLETVRLTEVEVRALHATIID